MLRIRALKFAVALVAAVMMLAGFSTNSRAASGVVHLKVVKAGFILGIGGGRGTLTFHGARYPLTVGGIGLGSFGIAGATLVGTAYNLHRASDIAGTYGAAGAGATFVGGAAMAQLQNEKGVVLKLRGIQTGFQISLGLAGMTIAVQ
jgi:hypothetical protein